ncbi:MAG: hypothetical protein WCE42_22970 [Rhizobium ruizarguesonis]
MLRSLVVVHKINFPIDPRVGLVFRAEYSTLLKSGHVVTGEGYEGLVAALVALRSEFEGELAEEHEEQQKIFLAEKIEELRLLLDEHLAKREIQAEAAVALQRQAVEAYFGHRKNLRGLLIAETRFFGAGVGPSTLSLDGTEISYGSTPADLLANVVAAIPGTGAAYTLD